MKKAISLIALALCTTSAFAAEIKVPRTLATPVSYDNKTEMKALLVSLLEEYEEVKLGDDLAVYGEEGEKLCVKSNPTTLVCQIDYNSERWNGSMYATFKIEGFEVVALKAISFDGNY